MRNALILHGTFSNSKGNWFPWLKRELESRGYEVWVPDLPKSDMPDKNKWLGTIFSNKKWHFDDESIIVGHSAGASFALRVLEEIAEGIKIHKAILVSPAANMGTKPEFFAYRKSLVGEPFDWVKIRKSCDEFFLIHSDKDPYDCGADQGKIIQEKIGGELIIKKGEGHFNLEKGPQYKKFPLLLDLIG